MKKSILIMFLVASTMVASAQNEFSTPKYGSVLMECFYNLKISSSTNFSPEDQEKIKQRITDMCGYLEAQLTLHKTILLKKLGLIDFNELGHQIKNYQEYTTTTEDTITPNQKMSVLLWIKLSKVEVEKIFIKLNRE